jgi:dephospho-CoA kinase
VVFGENHTGNAVRVIGLTGGLATGKTTVARMLAQRGAVIVDADELVRVVEQRGQPAFDEIVTRFGDQVVGPHGDLDRDRLGRIVFADASARSDLERIIHPRVGELIAQHVAKAAGEGAQVIVVDVPLLFETDGERAFDGVLLVYAPESVQLERLRARSGFDDAEARRRIQAQQPIERKRARATWTIDNGGPLAATEAQVSRWWKEVTG